MWQSTFQWTWIFIATEIVKIFRTLLLFKAWKKINNWPLLSKTYKVAVVADTTGPIAKTTWARRKFAEFTALCWGWLGSVGIVAGITVGCTALIRAGWNSKWWWAKTLNHDQVIANYNGDLPTTRLVSVSGIATELVGTSWWTFCSNRTIVYNH